MDVLDVARSAANGFIPEPWPEQLVNLPRLLDTMERRNIDGLVSYYTTNVFYLANFSQRRFNTQEGNGHGAVVFSRHHPDHPIVIVPDFEVTYFAGQPTWVKDRRVFRSLMLPLDIEWTKDSMDRFIPPAMRGEVWVDQAKMTCEEDMVRAIHRAMADLGLTKGRVGFDNMSFAPVIAKEYGPDFEVADVYGMLKHVRSVKTPVELEIMRKSTAINQAALQHAVSSWAKGMTWREMQWIYYNECSRLGGTIVDRAGMIMTNPKGADDSITFQTSTEPDFELEQGTAWQFDCHGNYLYYNWDGGKTWYINEDPSGDIRRIAEACYDAMHEVVSAMKPGATMRNLQILGRQTLAKHSVPMTKASLIFFHGLGLENSDRETSVGVSSADWALEEGQVVAAHTAYPGDDHHRHYIEEVGVVTANGLEPFFTWDYRPLTNA